MTSDSGVVATESWPEHRRLAAVQDQAQVIGEFLENTKYTLAEYHERIGGGEDLLWPVTATIQQILADYFGIDLTLIEAEKRAMLAAMEDVTP